MSTLSQKINTPVFEMRGNTAYAYGSELPAFKPSRVEYYRQDTPPVKAHPPALSDKGLELTPIQFVYRGSIVGSDASAHDGTSLLNFDQFHSLYSAVGGKSGWWPLADPQFDIEGFFGKLELFMLSKNGKPIGFSCIERNYEGKPDTAGIVFVGIIPSEQGKGYGSLLFKHIMARAWDGQTQSVELNTIPDLDVMTGTSHSHNKAASDLYIRNGFSLIKSENRLPEEGKLHELNIPAFYERQNRILELIHGRHPDYNAHERRLFTEFDCLTQQHAR